MDCRIFEQMEDQLSNEYLEKLRSIGTMTRQGTTNTVKVRSGSRLVQASTEHWDGRKDATVYPETVRYEARVNRSGEIAEVAQMSDKEKRSRYGE